MVWERELIRYVRTRPDRERLIQPVSLFVLGYGMSGLVGTTEDHFRQFVYPGVAMAWS